MAVYYKFKSAKDYDSISIDGRFISVAILKERIFESKQLGRGTDFDLVVTNAQTDEEYIDEAMLVPKNTSVLVRRVPGRPRMPIVTGQVIEQDKPKVENNMSNVSQPTNSRFLGVDSSAMGLPEDSELDEFGNDLYAIPEVLPVQGNPILDAPQSSKADEDSKIRAFIDTPALDLQCQTSNHRQGLWTGYERKNDGRSWICRDGLERKTPPQGYVCHRCKMPGHFIQHCHTNGDPNFDIKRVQLPTGIPKSMLMATRDGSYALPSGGVAILMPNEDAFDREVEGLPSTRSRGDLPPELHCPLCKEVMKDAVLTSKCCFKSFCDKCIRDQVISKAVCACGATNILADDLLPNQTLRETINRVLESNNSSAENASRACKVQGMESRTSHPKMVPKIPSPTLSATSKGQPLPPPQTEERSNVKEGNAVTAPLNTLHCKRRTEKVANGSGAMHDSMNAKELPSQGSALLFNGEFQQKPVSGEAGKKKKKKKKAHLPLNATEIQWNIPQNIATENYLPFGATVCNPYWTGIQPGIDGYMAHYGGSFPQMSYGLGPFGVPFGVLPQDPHGYIMPPVEPHRNLGNFGMCLNTGPPTLSTEEFETRKADLRRKPGVDSQGKSRELSKDQELRREVSSTGDVPPLKTECKPLPQRTADHRRRSESSSVERLARDTEPPRPYTKRKSEYDSSRRESRHSDDYHRNNHEQHSHRYHRSESSSAAARSASATVPPPHKSATTTASRHLKESVLTRNGFSGEDSAASKTRKQHSSSIEVSRTSAVAAVEYESSDDDDRNFKRRRTR